MKEKIKILVLADLTFLALLVLSGLTKGVLSTVVYILAFILPFTFAIVSSKTSIESTDGLFPVKNVDITMSGVFPTIITVIVISSITSRIMNLFGKENVVQLGDSLFIALLLHAVLPAVLEEGLFRYLPMRMLAKDNARVCILISALFFALSHHSLFSIPYAFVAGVAFMTLDIISGSVLPSLVIHLINNALSVIMMFYSVDGNSAILINTLIAILACGSLIYLVMIRERVRRAILENFSEKEKYRFSYDILLLVIPTLVISLSELFN